MKKQMHQHLLRVFLLATIGFLQTATATAQQRIVTLSPHLTEWVFALGAQDSLVAVSAYSDFPKEALKLPVIADYQGVNMAALMQLEPTLVLAWQGGNKVQDISRIESLGIPVFLSSPQSPQDIALELISLSKIIGKEDKAQEAASTFIHDLEVLEKRYAKRERISVFYYSWQAPLMTIGGNAWGNKLLNVCGAQSTFHDSPTDYPTVSVQQVILKQPQVLLSVSTLSIQQAESFWQAHNSVLNAPLITANPDVLSRFTLRLLPELKTLCRKINGVL